MRRLEHDLNRFTIELEADTAGITEILEQSERIICLHVYTHVHTCVATLLEFNHSVWQYPAYK